MPQNSFPLHKKIQHQHLDKYKVLLVDDSTNSPDYFVLSDVPEEFSAGKNSFKIFGNPATMQTGTKILVEILDSNGNTVYYEVPDYVDRSKRRVISIYIYPETAFGLGRITIIGVASNVPKEWKNQFNIKWQKDIFIDPLKRNQSEIIFNELPKVNLEEVFGSYNKINYSRNSSRTSTHFEVIEPSSSLDYRYLTSGKELAGNFESLKKTTTSNLIGQKTAGNSIQVGINLDAGNIDTERSSIARGVNAPGGFEYDVPAGAFLTISGSDFLFEKNMVGGKLVINPYNLKPDTNLSGTYEPVISEILSETQAKASFPYQLSSSKSDKTTIKKFTSSSFNLTYETQPEFSSSQAFRTFAFLKIGNIDPISGEIYRIKTYAKSHASVTDYELIGNTIIEGKNLFVNTGSLSMEESYGDFVNSNFVSSYWKAESVDTQFPPVLGYSSANLYNGLKITGFGFPQKDEGHWKVYPSSSINQPYFFKDNQYQLKFDVFGSKRDTVNPKIKMYMSGSSFIESPSNVGLGKYIGEIELTANTKTFRNLSMNFIPDLSGYGVPIFIIESGYWNLSDVRVLPLDEAGFSPNHVNVMLPINSIWDNNLLDFKYEFYDYSDKLASQFVELKNVQFQSGSPSYVQGRHNLVTGSQFIGNRIGTGIQMSGVDSAFIMNPDYDGFISASQGIGSEGFMIWSGSVHPTWPDVYNGVGIELIASSHSYFRYRTNPSELDIRTDKFYFGGPVNYISGETGSIVIQADNIILSGSGVGVYTENFFLGSATQFMSGSNGLIEISSSNFHLSSSGEVSAKAARLEHYVYADFIGSRVITIDDTNYSDFVVEYVDGGVGWSYLDLSQAEFGSSMFIRFETSSNYPITHIVTPDVTNVDDINVGATITTEFAVSASVNFYDIGSGSRDISSNSNLTEANAIHNLSGSFSFTGFSFSHQSIDQTYEYTGSLRSRDNARYIWTKGIGWGLNSTTNYDRTNVSFLKTNISFLYGARRNEWIPAQAMSFSDTTGSAVDAYDTTYFMPAKDLTLTNHHIGSLYESPGYDGIYASMVLPDYIESEEVTVLLYYSFQSAVSQSSPPVEATVDVSMWKPFMKTVNYQIENDFSNTGVPSMSAATVYSSPTNGVATTYDNYELGKMYAFETTPENANIKSGQPLGMHWKFWRFVVDGPGSVLSNFGDGTVRIYGARIITDKETNIGGFNSRDFNDEQAQQPDDL